MTWKRFIGMAALAFSLPVFASAQDAPEQKGRDFNGYNVHQSIEFGGRITSGLGGNTDMYNTLVNLKEGARLMDQSLSMRSMGEGALFFDSLNESASGLGGDPNQLVRFQMSKNKWYNFSAQYRKDEYYSDFNLLGSSLAVPSPNPFNVNVFNNSPHRMNTNRSMSDFNLKLLPQSWMSFRLGYGRGKDVGPAYTSVHSPGDVIYLENFSTRSTRYKLGMDVKPLARTQISYDFIYERDRNDIAGVSDANALFHLGTTGLLVDPGFTYEPNAKIPSCTFTAGNNVNSTCSGFLAYARTQPVRTDLPTHQVSFTSSYIPRLDLSGSATYTSGSAKTAAYNETFSRFSSPTYSQNAIQGSSASSLITGNADVKATFHISKSWSFDEKFRWVNWRVPGSGIYTNTLTTNLTAATILTPAALPAPTTNTLYYNYFGENSKYDTMQLNYRPTSKIGAWVGYKLGVRDIISKAQTNTLTLATGVTAQGTPSSELESEMEHHALVGVSVRPIEGLHLRAEGDLMSADGAYTLITPRHAQKIKADGEYELGGWGSISATTAFDRRSNDGYALFPAALRAQGEEYKAHTHYYDVNLTLHPVKKIDLDMGWSNEKIYERAPQCIPLTPGSANYGFATTNGTLTTTNLCQFTTGKDRANVYPMFSRYQEDTNSVYAMVVLKPIHRVTVNLGYDVTSNAGYQNWFRADNGKLFLMPTDAAGNAVVATTQTATGSYVGLYPWLPMGTLAYNFHRPVAGVSVDLAKGFVFKGGFNNFDYNEKGPKVTPVAARDFHGNAITLSLKHWF